MFGTAPQDQPTCCQLRVQRSPLPIPFKKDVTVIQLHSLMNCSSGMGAHRTADQLNHSRRACAGTPGMPACLRFPRALGTMHSCGPLHHQQWCCAAWNAHCAGSCCSHLTLGCRTCQEASQTLCVSQCGRQARVRRPLLSTPEGVHSTHPAGRSTAGCPSTARVMPSRSQHFCALYSTKQTGKCYAGYLCWQIHVCSRHMYMYLMVRQELSLTATAFPSRVRSLAYYREYLVTEHMQNNQTQPARPNPS